MKNNSVLLSHKWNKVGWIIIGIELLYFAIELILRLGGGHLFPFYRDEVGFWYTVYRIIMPFIFITIPYLALMLVCISKEKNEDEYIQHLRSKSVFLIVFFLFILNTLKFASQNVLYALKEYELYYYIDWCNGYFHQMPVAACLYIMLFKGMIYYNKKKSEYTRE